MRWFLFSLVLCSAALAGEIYEASCDDCGYTEDGLWFSSGLEDPFGVFALYWAGDLRRVVSVEFDLSLEFGGLIGYDFAPIRHNTKIWDVIEEHSAEYEEFFYAWSPPAVIEGDLPPGSRIASDRPETGPFPRMLLVEGVWEEGKVFPCPACGERTLRFTVTGEWD